VCLGASITQDGDGENDICWTIGKASAMFGRVGKIWKDRIIAIYLFTYLTLTKIDNKTL